MQKHLFRVYLVDSAGGYFVGRTSVGMVCSNGSSSFLVSTYVVCERLSVMHEPAGVVENLVQILQNTPIL